MPVSATGTRVRHRATTGTAHGAAHGQFGSKHISVANEQLKNEHTHVGMEDRNPVFMQLEMDGLYYLFFSVTPRSQTKEATHN